MALIVYIETSVRAGIRHIGELAGRIHGHARRGLFLLAIVPMDVKAPVVALMVYIETSFEFGIRHISELARRIHGHGDRVCSCGDRPYGR